MNRKLTQSERDGIQRQIDQISAFLDHCYDGYCHDLKISWTIREGYDPVRGVQKTSYAGLDDYVARKGQHTEIGIGYGDAYYGSTSMGHMLHDAAYEWREKLSMRLKDDEPTYVDLVTQ